MKTTFLILLSIFSLWSINAQNYGNGNGSIISEDTIHDDWQVIRKKHIQTVKMAEDCDVPNDYKSLWKDFSPLYESDYILIGQNSSFSNIRNFEENSFLISCAL